MKRQQTIILETQSELKDIQVEHEREKEVYSESSRKLREELKLKRDIINKNIPIEFQVSRQHRKFSDFKLFIINLNSKRIIDDNVFWNEELGEWQLNHIAYTGNQVTFSFVYFIKIYVLI